VVPVNPHGLYPWQAWLTVVGAAALLSVIVAGLLPLAGLALAAICAAHPNDPRCQPP
jgi:hypothetical protein